MITLIILLTIRYLSIVLVKTSKQIAMIPNFN